MADQITIRPAEGTWVVRAGGAVIGESENALELTEVDHAPVIYFPRDDVAIEFLDDSEKVTTCPWKGEASHFSIVTKSTILNDCAWSYNDPKSEVAQIKGHLAFYPGETVTVEQV